MPTMTQDLTQPSDGELESNEAGVTSSADPAGGPSVGGPKLHWKRIWSVVLGIGVLVGILAGTAQMQQAGWFAWLGPSPSPSSTPTPTLTPSPTYAILSPVDGQQVRNSVGVTVKGEAKNLEADETLWVFDEDLEGEWRFYFVTDQPLRLSKDQFSVRDEPIGSPSDAPGTEYSIVMVSANRTCRTALNGVGLNQEGDRALHALPPGCKVVDDVKVVKSGS